MGNSDRKQGSEGKGDARGVGEGGKSDIGQNYPVPAARSMLWCNFLWGLRN